ncbi:type I polyketide synthase [Nocardia abscessus]|uniref:type I polyketide synthase n=1 Tax=Nocardia abscessus TaxID=120957 RepID=UPI0003181F64|nr:type I polyketide synthase [Nocardia abscessus]MCC3326467.1 type I polyketide synthase [Nocardia abscessus]
MSGINDAWAQKIERPQPIAIIGMACRLPGGIESPDQFWESLLAGACSTGPLPAGRWDEYRDGDPDVHRALDAATTQGNFLDDVARFDSRFFRVAPREAELMDPQQRIILETTWEALEHAGIPPASLAGTDTGVYMGVGSDDYGRWMLQDPAAIEAWMGVGASICGVANRVSYCFDLRGASMSVDTACSSSLVAVHLACQALRTGEIPLAIVGGVNIIAGPGLTLILDSAGATSKDGQSKSFDDSADGYGRGEGAGVVILKSLSAAQRDGDRILALLLGTAVHQDGRTNGIMAPDAAAQEHLLRKAYSAAGVDASSVDFVEAHGTGTPTGDPIEAQAMAAVFGADRPADRPCLIGSSKANVGHLEAGAGIVGLIKATMALKHGVIPAQPNSTPSKAIPWTKSGLRVVQQITKWPDETATRRAGVSAYGYGGTLAHVVLEQAPTPTAVEDPESDYEVPVLVPLSAHDESGLVRVAERLANFLSTSEAALADVASTLIHHREHHRCRAGVVATTTSELIDTLRSLATDVSQYSGGGRQITATTGPVFVFSGHGSQWAGMGAELLRNSREFSLAIDDLDPIFQAELGISARSALMNGEFAETHLAQPMIYAMQIGLAAEWHARGVRPAAVLGHSVGEIAAAAVAGVFDSRTGARLVCRRSLLLQKVAGQGSMLFAAASFDVLARVLDKESGAMPVIYTSPRSSVIAGSPEAIDEVEKLLTLRGIETRRVASDVAFHSVQMEPLLQDLRIALAELPFTDPQIRVYSTALEDARATAARNGEYWAQNLRNPVRFEQAVSAAIADGFRHFIEVSPHPVVTHAIHEILEHHDSLEGAICHSTRRQRPERFEIELNRAQLYAAGTTIDWTAAPRRMLIDLPTYPWARTQHWFRGRSRTVRNHVGHDKDSHTLLGTKQSVHLPTAATIWTTLLTHEQRPYPGRHCVEGTEVVPAAVIVNTLLAASATRAKPIRLRDISFRVPITTTHPLEIQVCMSGDRLAVASRRADTEDWTENISARVDSSRTQLSDGTHLPDATVFAEPTSNTAEITEHLHRVGVTSMGFEWNVTYLCRTSDGFAAVIEADPGASTTWAPALDAILSIAAVAATDSRTLKMAASIQDIVLAGQPPRTTFIEGTFRRGLTDTIDVTITAISGEALGHLGGIEYRSPDADADVDAVSGLLHSIDWRPIQSPGRQRRDRRSPDRLITVGRPLAWTQPGGAMTTDHVETASSLPADLDDRAVVLVHPENDQAIGPAEQAKRAAWALIEAVQVIAARSLVKNPRIWAITRGVRRIEHTESLASAPLWGIGRVMANEHPQLWGGIVDLPAHDQPEDLRRLVELLAVQPSDDVISIEAGTCHTARLVPARPTTGARRLRCRPDGTYVITGGLGALGREVATWLIDRGAGAVVLVSRSGGTPGDNAVAKIRGSSTARVRVLHSDVADLEAFANALDQEVVDLPPVRGVVHAAGVLDNKIALDVSPESLTSVMRPKVDGAQTLHQLFPPGELDFLVFFSSCGPLLGLTGQTSYAAANSYLDAIAAYRRHHGDETLSLSWTSWRGLGMSTSSALIDAELSACGAADITADEAFAAWDAAKVAGEGHLAVVRFTDVDAAQHNPLLTALPKSAPPVDAPSLVEAQPDQSRIETTVRTRIAGETGFSISDISADRALNDLGLDSVMTLTIRRKLERDFRVKLPASLMWDQPSAASIALYIANQIGNAQTAR